MKKENKKFYFISSKISWKGFKKLHDEIVIDSGPKPQNFERILWKMIRNKQLFAWFAEDIPNDMGLGLKIPKKYRNWQLNIVS